MASLRSYFDKVNRKMAPEDPRELSADQIAELMLGERRTLQRIRAHLEERPELWDQDPRGLMQELHRSVPGVGKATAAWYVLNELQIAERCADMAGDVDDVGGVRQIDPGEGAEGVLRELEEVGAGG